MALNTNCLGVTTCCTYYLFTTLSICHVITVRVLVCSFYSTSTPTEKREDLQSLTKHRNKYCLHNIAIGHVSLLLFCRSRFFCFICIELGNSLLRTFRDVTVFLFNKCKALVQWLRLLFGGHRARNCISL